MADDEPKKKNPLGPTGEVVARNVKRLREGQRLAFTELAALLDRNGRPIPTLGLRHIEAQKRRVDADDLMALAAALGVSPISLLMPANNADGSEVSKDDILQVAGHDQPLGAGLVWDWLRAERPLPGVPSMTFIERAWPAWQREWAQAAVENSVQAQLFRNFGPGGDPHGDD